MTATTCTTSLRKLNSLCAGLNGCRLVMHTQTPAHTCVLIKATSSYAYGHVSSHGHTQRLHRHTCQEAFTHHQAQKKQPPMHTQPAKSPNIRTAERRQVPNVTRERTYSTLHTSCSSKMLPTAACCWSGTHKGVVCSQQLLTRRAGRVPLLRLRLGCVPAWPSQEHAAGCS